MRHSIVKTASLISGLALSLIGTEVSAQTWKPEKNVEIVVYSAPGGSNDKTARSIERIIATNKLIPSTVTVVNKTGGGGNIQLSYISQHEKDPHYLMIQTPTLLGNHITGKSQKTYTDYTPIASMVNDYVVYAVNADSNIKTGKDLMAALKKDPKSISIGFSTTLGSHNHVAAGLLMKKIGGDPKALKVVPFKGAADAITQLLGGHIDMVTTAAGNVSAHVESGKLRVIAIASNKRMGGMFAQVPTWKEQGVDLVWSNWRVIFGPKGLTQEQIKTWQNVLTKVHQSPEWKKDLELNYWGDDFAIGDQLNKDLASDYEVMRAALTELGMAQ
jgi:putative tricarboxylic transport membrane protein